MKAGSVFIYVFDNPYVSAVSGHVRRRDKYSPCVRKMKKAYEHLREKLGHKPTVKKFDVFLATLGPDERESWKMDVCGLGYGYYYRKMPGAYRKFIRKYMEHDRECERRYIRKYTVRGDLLYSPFRPELLLELVKLVEFTDRETPPSSLGIASCLLMGFDYPDSVRGLASHLREAGHSAEAVLVLAGKREVTDEF